MAEDDKKPEIDMDVGLPESMVNRAGPTVPAEPVPMITWTNRRRMAWYSFWLFILFTGVVLALIHFGATAPEEKKLEQIVNVYFYFVSVVGAIILGYFGTTTLPFLGRR